MSDSTYHLYNYTPSIPAAAIFAVIFFASGAIHGVQLYRTKGWYFLVMLIGTFMESIGYVGRIISHNDPQALGPFIMQELMILLAPALLTASIYVVLGRIIVSLHAERLSLIRVSRLTKFFVCGDVFSFLIQSGGGGLMSQGSDLASTGQKIVLVGLAAQILWFGGFVVVSAVFHTRMRKYKVPEEQEQWLRLMYVLYAASGLILVRSLFRMVEFGQGHDGAIMANEVYLYIFDAVLMTIVVLLFNVFHPPAYLRQMTRYSEGVGLIERV
ncbi:RTA1 domain protein [Mucidula mucida]|nr:RTA1 domain protein [Mucidula mucida]